MYTKRIFPVKGAIKWTRRFIILFLLLIFLGLSKKNIYWKLYIPKNKYQQ